MTQPQQTESAPASVLVVSSFVARGSVGARAAFALERLGHRTTILPTVILPWHPGHGRSHRLAIADADFERLAADLAGAPWLSEIGAVITGYFASPGQVMAAAALVAAVKAANPGALHVADPVIGDDGGLYVAAAIAEAQKAALVPVADLVTPNRFELGWLAGAETGDLDAIAAAARRLGPARVAVTSAPALMRGRIAAALVTAEAMAVAETRRLDKVPNGTGDLFAALMTARLLAGDDDAAALSAAAAGTFEVIAQSVAAGSDELDLAACQAALVHPTVPVEMRLVGGCRARPTPLGG